MEIVTTFRNDLKGLQWIQLGDYFGAIERQCLEAYERLVIKDTSRREIHASGCMIDILTRCFKERRMDKMSSGVESKYPEHLRCRRFRKRPRYKGHDQVEVVVKFESLGIAAASISRTSSFSGRACKNGKGI